MRPYGPHQGVLRSDPGAPPSVASGLTDVELMAEYLVSCVQRDLTKLNHPLYRLGGRDHETMQRWNRDVSMVIDLIRKGDDSFWLQIGANLVRIEVAEKPRRLVLSDGFAIDALLNLPGCL